MAEEALQQAPEIDTSGLSMGGAMPVTQPGLTFPTGIGTVNQLPEPIAARRTDKTIRGLGDVLPYDSDTVHQMFVQGNENALRNQIALKIDANKSVENINAFKSGLIPLPSPGQGATGLIPTPTDPDTVIEKAYTDSNLNTLATAYSCYD